MNRGKKVFIIACICLLSLGAPSFGVALASVGLSAEHASKAKVASSPTKVLTSRQTAHSAQALAQNSSEKTCQKAVTAKTTVSAPSPKKSGIESKPVTAQKKVMGHTIATPSKLATPQKIVKLRKTGKKTIPKTFNGKAFGEKSKAPSLDPSLAQRINKAQGVTPVQYPQIDSERFEFAGGKQPVPDSVIKPRETTFPGASNTLSQMDEESPPEAIVKYKIEKDVAARVNINRQDRNSPIYSPLKKDQGVNAAGLYLDMGVDDDVSLRVGGEVRSNETASSSSEDRTSRGASMGLEWKF